VAHAVFLQSGGKTVMKKVKRIVKFFNKSPHSTQQFHRDVHRRGPPPPPRNFDPDRRREILIQTAVFGVLAVRETTDQ
jgi:hypothetical protein